MIRSKLPKGDGTQLVGGAAAAGAVMRSTCRAGMCGQPCHLAGDRGPIPLLGTGDSALAGGEAQQSDTAFSGGLSGIPRTWQGQGSQSAASISCVPS